MYLEPELEHRAGAKEKLGIPKDRVTLGLSDSSSDPSVLINALIIRSNGLVLGFEEHYSRKSTKITRIPVSTVFPGFETPRRNDTRLIINNLWPWP